MTTIPDMSKPTHRSKKLHAADPKHTIIAKGHAKILLVVAQGWKRNMLLTERCVSKVGKQQTTARRSSLNVSRQKNMRTMRTRMSFRYTVKRLAIGPRNH
ncbi:hypothetical protein KCU83_g524, partial [Aureobasidium melanogenum]